MGTTGIVKSTLVGGIIVFIWLSISWMVLPWHRATMHPFQDGLQVEEVIQQNTPASGVYIYPGHDMKEKQCGMSIFTVVKKDVVTGNMTKHIIFSLIILFIGAFLISWLLLQTKHIHYWKNVFFVTIVALTAGVIVILPGMNWWGFPAGYTLVAILDLVIGWFLAGLAMGKLIKKKS